MQYEAAVEWLEGKRSMQNLVPQDPYDTWAVRVAQADAARTKEAYYTVKAHQEGLLPAPPDGKMLVDSGRVQRLIEDLTVGECPGKRSPNNCPLHNATSVEELPFPNCKGCWLDYLQRGEGE